MSSWRAGIVGAIASTALSPQNLTIKLNLWQEAKKVVTLPADSKHALDITDYETDHHPHIEPLVVLQIGSRRAVAEQCLAIVGSSS